MVFSAELHIKRDPISNEAFSYPFELIEFFIKSGKTTVLLFVNSFFVNGLRYLAINFNVLYM